MHETNHDLYLRISQIATYKDLNQRRQEALDLLLEYIGDELLSSRINSLFFDDAKSAAV